MRKALYGAALGIFVLSSLAASKALAQDAQAGAQVYQEQKCARCHGEGGKGDGPTAEKLKGKVEIVDWTKKAVMSELTDEYLTKIIADGGKAVGKSALMPRYANKTTDAQIKDLVMFIRSLASEMKAEGEVKK